MLNSETDQRNVERISSLCSEVLLNGGDVSEEKMQEELNKLIEFKSDNPIITAYKNKILKTKFPKEMVMMTSMKSMYENHSQQERAEAQQVLKQAVKSKDKEDLIQPNGNQEGR